MLFGTSSDASSSGNEAGVRLGVTEPDVQPQWGSEIQAPPATPPKDSHWLCLRGRSRSERENRLHYNSQLKGLEEEEGQKNNCLRSVSPDLL